MTETCLICGQAHKNPIRGGKVAYLRNCFKKGRPARREHLPPTGRYRNVAAPPNAAKLKRKAGFSALMKALTGWGANS